MTWWARTTCLVALIVLAAWAPTGPTFDLSWHSIDGGGGASAGGTFEMRGVIGQPDAGAPMTGGVFSLSGGFLAGAGALPCPADIAGGGSVDVTDLLQLLADWGTCPGTIVACPSDIDGNGFVDVSDLLALLAAWGPCP